MRIEREFRSLVHCWVSQEKRHRKFRLRVVARTPFVSHGLSPNSHQFNDLCLKHPINIKFAFASYVFIEPAVIYGLIVILWCGPCETLCARDVRRREYRSGKYDAELDQQISSGKTFCRLSKDQFY